MSGSHIAVVDLGYGDAGKGTVVDWLCASRPVTAVLRFNGGGQAGHNVVSDDGQWHTFSQFGSGTLRGVPTHLTRFMIVDPLSLATEADHLRGLLGTDPIAGITVDRDALVSTPYHRAANRAREIARGADRHGSCGMGVGETKAHQLSAPAEAIRVGDLAAPKPLRRKLIAVRDRLTAELGPLPDAPPIEDCVEVYGLIAARLRAVDAAYTARLLASGPCVFEGAQGVLLDQWRGFHPYTTWSTTTFDNVAALWAQVYRLGVLRTTTTRHGAGPLVTEDAALTAALADPRNHSGPWQGPFRVGHFDAVAHRYAIEVCDGVDGLALTHLDAPARRPDLRVATGYRIGDTVVDRLAPGPFTDLDYQAGLTAMAMAAEPILHDRAPADWIDAVADELAIPIVLASTGPAARDKRPLADALS